MKIQIPDYAKIENYRTMTAEKKKAACKDGNKLAQNEWMVEEINEFYEAVNNEDEVEILDEGMGLIRTAQQFQESKRVMNKWEKVKPDILKVFKKKKTFMDTFKKWHHKKLCKNQALGVKPEHLMEFAGLKY